MSRTSSIFWPYIKRIAQVVMPIYKATAPLPGAAAEAGTKVLIELQDEIDKANTQKDGELRSALEAIHNDTSAIVEALRSDHLDLQPSQLQECSIAIAEALYLKRVANEYFYADFKGVTQMQRFVSLELDAIFVDLKARPQKETFGSTIRISSVFDGESFDSFEIQRRDLTDFLLQDADTSRRSRIEDRLAEQDREAFSADKLGPPQSIDQLLKKPGGLVLLGGPGSGKTTLIKRLARSRALAGPADVSGRTISESVSRTAYPELPAELFPVVVSIALYDDARGSRDLSDFDIVRYVEERLAERWGAPLITAFHRRWAAGEVLLLIDGLDEIADQARRIGAARAVDAAVTQLANNRLIVTSRIIGYSLCSLSVPVVHATLEPFSTEDVATFARQWHRAYEQVAHPEAPQLDQAERDAQSLINDIRKNERVAELATNPLMLTIIALIKHQHITLPDRRVELYEKALETLIHSWNQARSLSGKPIGETPRMETTKKVWSQVAFWMHEHSSRGTLRRQQLLEKLIEVLKDDGKPEIQASEIAESYLRAATETSGLLEARGQDRFAFMHQTFQEYLAAIRLATLCRKSTKPLLELGLIDNPRWHEVIRLAAGYIGVQLADEEQLSELIQTLLDESRDPLEPYLLTGLRLAASCIADDVGYRQSDSDAVIKCVFEKAKTALRPKLKSALTNSLTKTKARPSDGLIQLLIDTFCVSCVWHDDSTLQRQSLQMLVQLAYVNSQVADHLCAIFNTTSNYQLKAECAIALWQSQIRCDDNVLAAMLIAKCREDAAVILPNTPKVESRVIKMLEHKDRLVRVGAAITLDEWGLLNVAIPALKAMLADWSGDFHLLEFLINRGLDKEFVAILTESSDDANIFKVLPRVLLLVGWGKSETIPQLAKYLASHNSSLRRFAKWTLLPRNPNSDGVISVIKCLEVADPFHSFEAQELLIHWGRRESAEWRLLELLDHEFLATQSRAVAVLARWGATELMIEKTMELLRTGNFNVAWILFETIATWPAEPRLRHFLRNCLIEDKDFALDQIDIAEALGRWGDEEFCMKPLLSFLSKKTQADRDRVIRIVGNWRHCRPVVTRVLYELSERPKSAPPDSVVDWLVAVTNGGSNPRTIDVANWIAENLQPPKRDSQKKHALREILYHWVWEASGQRE